MKPLREREKVCCSLIPFTFLPFLSCLFSFFLLIALQLIEKIQTVTNERDAIIAYKERLSKQQRGNTAPSSTMSRTTGKDDNVNHMLEMVKSFLPLLCVSLCLSLSISLSVSFSFLRNKNEWKLFEEDKKKN
jgi:predicted PurR-regulated permease PerM